MEYVHKTAGLRQFTTNESSFKVQGFTKPPHMSDMETISFANSKVLWSNHTQIRKFERCFDAILTPSWRINLQLQKLLSKWVFVNAKQVAVPFNASVRIPWLYRNVSMYWMRKRYRWRHCLMDCLVTTTCVDFAELKMKI